MALVRGAGFSWGIAVRSGGVHQLSHTYECSAALRRGISLTKRTTVMMSGWFACGRLCGAVLVLLMAGCAGDDSEERPVYISPNLPRDHLASVFIEDDDDNFIFVTFDAVAKIEAVDGLAVNAKEVYIPPGRHSLDIEVSYPYRSLTELASILVGIGMVVAGEDLDAEKKEDERPQRPSRYDKVIPIVAEAGHRYQIEYREEEVYDTYPYRSYSYRDAWQLDVWIEDVTFRNSR